MKIITLQNNAEPEHSDNFFSKPPRPLRAAFLTACSGGSLKRRFLIQFDSLLFHSGFFFFLSLLFSRTICTELLQPEATLGKLTYMRCRREFCTMVPLGTLTG